MSLYCYLHKEFEKRFGLYFKTPLPLFNTVKLFTLVKKEIGK